MRKTNPGIFPTYLQSYPYYAKTITFSKNIYRLGAMPAELNADSGPPPVTGV